ncbi:MAG TPA: hypothetical protein VHP14_17105 [Anaerolineales bacterium]|nr:hypothetical protein [Anaerolineales bacterium]
MNGESYLIGFLGFVIFLIAFLVILRQPVKTGWFLLEVWTGFIVHIVCSIFGFLLVEGFSYWYQTSLYAFLWFCFFFVSSIYSASVSVGIISYLYKQPNRTASLLDVYQNCIVRVFEERAEFLIATHQVQKADQGYMITPAGRKTVDQLRKINKLLGMESRGFYSSDSTLLEEKRELLKDKI